MLYYTRPEKLDRVKHSSLLGPFVSYEENEVVWIQLIPSQHFIFFLNYELAQYVRVLHYTRPEKLDKDKHSCLLGPFVSYEENEVLWIQLLHNTLLSS